MMFSNYSGPKARALHGIIQGRINRGAKFVIVEGFDGEGKTTFSKNLSVLVGWKYIHYPLSLVKYNNVFDYIKEMIETYDVIDNTVVDRHVFSTIAYNDIKEYTWFVETLIKSISREGFLVIGGFFDELVIYKLKLYPQLLEIYKKVPKVTVYPWLFREANIKDTLDHMTDEISKHWVMSKLVSDE
jgi:hypothetical protein